jgi:protein TonB
MRRAAQAAPALRPAIVETAPVIEPEPAPVEEPPVMLAPTPAPLPEMPQLRVPVSDPHEPQLAPDAPRSAGLRGLFGRVSGMGSMMKRNLSPQAEPQRESAPATRMEPIAAPEPAPRFEPTRPAQQDEMSLEIPAFLRRQRS